MKEEDKEEDSEEKEEEASEEEEAHRHMTDATSVTSLDTLQKNVETEGSTGNHNDRRSPPENPNYGDQA